jgi:hypothetical protein
MDCINEFRFDLHMYMLMCREQNTWKIYKIQAANDPFANV